MTAEDAAAAAGGPAQNPTPGPSTRAPLPPVDRPVDAKASREQDKRRKVERNRLRKREEELLARLEAIDSEKSALNGKMAEPANYSDGASMKALQAAAEALETESVTLSFEWEAVASELEVYADLD